MKKRIETFLTEPDEASLSRRLGEMFPSLVVVDGSVWDTASPPIKPTIPDCESSIVMLWNREMEPTLPFRLRPDGRYDGPIVGPVVQLVRCRLEEGVLRSGSIAASSDVPLILDFINSLWRILRQCGTTSLRCINPVTGETINPSVRGYLLGPDAAAWCSVEAGRRLKDRSTENYYAPAQ